LSDEKIGLWSAEKLLEDCCGGESPMNKKKRAGVKLNGQSQGVDEKNAVKETPWPKEGAVAPTYLS
jgi:hypothetical protein